MRTLPCTAIAVLALLLQGCCITAPFTVAWRSNTTQQVADTEGRNERAADANTVNADKQTDISATVPTNTTRTSTKSAAAKPAGKPADEDDCLECRN